MNSSRIFLDICFFVFVALTWEVMGESPHENRAANMLEKIAKQNHEGVIRNNEGKVVSVWLQGEFLEETNVSLLTNVDSITTVKLQSLHGYALTPEAVASLSALPNLTNLVLMCFWNKLEPGVFAQVCKIKHLQRLFLWGVSPAREEFNAITNLQNLTSFGADVCSSFGSRELSLVATLPHLNSLVVSVTKVSADETNILKSCPSLTNFVFGGPIQKNNQ